MGPDACGACWCRVTTLSGLQCSCALFVHGASRCQSQTVCCMLLRCTQEACPHNQSMHSTTKPTEPNKQSCVTAGINAFATACAPARDYLSASLPACQKWSMRLMLQTGSAPNPCLSTQPRHPPKPLTHSRTVLSTLPDTTVRPSGVKAAAHTQWLWPARVAVQAPLARSHTLSVCDCAETTIGAGRLRVEGPGRACKRVRS